jgi:Rrf2 family protein
MPSSTRFAVAIHALTILALNEGQPKRSEQVASSANTNPTVIRRIFSLLGQAGLTRAQIGAGGGTLLARPAATITLLDVYRAVEDTDLFPLHRGEPDQKCSIGRNIQSVLKPYFDDAKSALETQLAAMSLADVAASVQARRRAGRPIDAALLNEIALPDI